MSKQLSAGLVFSALALFVLQSLAVADGQGFAGTAGSGVSNGNGQASNPVQPGAADRQRLSSYYAPNQRSYPPVTPGEADRQRLNTYYNGDGRSQYQGFDQINNTTFAQGGNYWQSGYNNNGGQWNGGYGNGLSRNYYSGYTPDVYNAGTYNGGTMTGYGNNNGGNGYGYYSSYNWTPAGNGYFYDTSRFGNGGDNWFGDGY